MSCKHDWAPTSARMVRCVHCKETAGTGRILVQLQSALAQAVSDREAAERETVRRIVDFAQGWARKAGVDGYALGAREHAVMRELLVAVLRGDWRKP